MLSVILLVVALAFFRLAGIVLKRMLNAIYDDRRHRPKPYLLGYYGLMASGLACCGGAIAVALHL